MLPWSAPGYGQGIFPGQAPFPGPASVAGIAEAISRENIYRQQQQQQALQSAFAGIADAMKQRQQDAIASQLLAGEAPRAEYAGPSSTPQQPTQTAAAEPPPLTDEQIRLQGDNPAPVAPVMPVQRTLAAMTPVTPVGTPSTSLSRGEAAQNAALGYPTKQLLPPTVLYAEKERQTKEDLDRLYRAAQIQHLTNLTAVARSGGRGSATADRYVSVADDSGNQIKVTGNEAAQLLAGGKGFSGASETKRGWELPDGTFTNDPTKASQFIPGVTAQSNAATDGTHVQVQFPRQKTATTLPANTWDAVKGGQGWHIVGGAGGGGLVRPAGQAAAQVGEKRVFPDGVRTWDGTKWTL